MRQMRIIARNFIGIWHKIWRKNPRNFHWVAIEQRFGFGMLFAYLLE